ncbi:hypothetical protein RHI9324_01667 [Rhizobium sp. CECT 9324]|nr:hypothetical protein RHI9324_01667 [Rhizobium sp. CECT 9324]
MTAFTGAGTSMPALPSWGTLVRNLVDEAAKDGRLDGVTAASLRAETKDVLYVIDEIYNAVGEAQTKARVCRLFSSLDRPTEAHTLLVRTAFDRILTLNYDAGLEMAYAEQHSQHVQSITAVQVSEVDDWLRHDATSNLPPILHWHGRSADASSIILSGSDYVSFYERYSARKETLRDVFKTHQVLMVGFGFSDPFIERELNSVMQPLPKANSHFAIIGVDADNQGNIQLERRKYSTKYKLETLFYPVGNTYAGPDHKALLVILEAIAASRPRSASRAVTSQMINKQPAVKEATISYRSSLFTIGDKVIYCEPNIWHANSGADAPVDTKISLSELLAGNFNCNLMAPHEYGLSNIGKRIVSELILAGRKALYRDAHGVPKYRKGIQADVDFAALQPLEEFTVVLDNFSVVEHQRTVRELVGTYEKVRIFVLQKTNFNGDLDDSLSELKFKSFNVAGFSRWDIRSVVNIMAPDRNSDDTSVIVEKVYADLLQLCIPLTPSNVIMYSSVLCKDGSFSPVSRLHIVDRFVAEALQRASDAYADNFNFINKIDLISEFCYVLFTKGIPTFTESEWIHYCKEYKGKNLVEFSATQILGDLHNGRIVVKDGSSYVFRYRMFFSYFVGRCIADRPEMLRYCLAENRHLELDGLVEVLCGMLPDCSPVLEDLTQKLTLSMEQFYESYPIRGLDFHKDAKWEASKQDSLLWDTVSDRLDKGPASTQELDELKTSIHAERRTADQKVSIIKFIASEKSVTNNAWYLTTALEGAKQASAGSKKAAAVAVMGGHVLAYEVASVFIPLIAEKKYVSWNGFTYINLIEDKHASEETSDEEANKERMQGLVAYALPHSMGRNAADQFGSRKLGQVFLALRDDNAIDTNIKRHLLFCLLIKSKPTGWLLSAKKQVGDTRRDDIYLRHMLYAALMQFNSEINSESERQGLKELLATMRLRRDVNLRSPSPKAIKRAIGQLDAGGFWEREKEDPNS